MTETAKNNFDAKKWYLSNFELFENSLNGIANSPFHVLRKEAIAKFSDLGFPTTRQEEWKYTSVAPILEHKFKLNSKQPSLQQTVPEHLLFKGLEQDLIVFVNGQYSEKLSTISSNTPGLTIDSLKNAFFTHNTLVEKYLGQIANFEKEAFVALNTAFTLDGVFLHVAKNTLLERPIHILYLSTAGEEASVNYPRNLFIAESGSEVKIVESYHHLSDSPYFNNVVTEIVLQENSKMNHIKLQEESEKSFHVAHTKVNQEYSSVLTSVNIDLGGVLVRNSLNILLNAENCESNMYGFYFGRGRQHIDNHTFIDHAMPHCYSNELYKGVLNGKAHAVFNGKILVRPDAQKTNALQSNKTLLLTNDAAINAKPQLEIFADDVKCTHGATIGQLDDEALFYLRTRGISNEVAGAMLRFAFAADVFEKIELESVRNKLNEELLERLQIVEGN
ncbi:MAG: Fe-S cluster assembly protein SufD [bacterium]